jgi:hypothetical protein
VACRVRKSCASASTKSSPGPRLLLTRLQSEPEDLIPDLFDAIREHIVVGNRELRAAHPRRTDSTSPLRARADPAAGRPPDPANPYEPAIPQPQPSVVECPHCGATVALGAAVTAVEETGVAPFAVAAGLPDAGHRGFRWPGCWGWCWR